MNITFEKQTSNGLLRNTERTWIASNGHTVKVTTEQLINSRCSYATRNAAFAKAHFVCECGKKFTTHGNPKKSTLDNHDAWFTPAQIEENINAMLAAWGK